MDAVTLLHCTECVEEAVRPVHVVEGYYMTKAEDGCFEDKINLKTVKNVDREIDREREREIDIKRDGER